MKEGLRKTLLTKRDSISPSQKIKKDAAIKQSLFALDKFMNAKSVLMYVSFRSEVDTTAQLQDILNMGKKLIVPLVNSKNRTLSLYQLKDISELANGYMGIPEPSVMKDRKVALKDIDIVIIPGSGFDPKGNRLGYGGGYYDRLLSKADNQIPAIALAFEEQITADIHAEPHDVKMDIIITDKRVIYCK